MMSTAAFFAGRRHVKVLPLHQSLELNSKGNKDRNEEELQPNPAHVDMQTIMLSLKRILAVDHKTSCCLNDESENIEENEHEGNAASSNAEDAVIGDIEVYHPAQSHVDEGIDPEWCEDDEEL